MHTPSPEAGVQTFNPRPSPPALRLPAGACDAHVHVFGPASRFAFAQSRNFTPADAPKETLFALHRQLGIARCVIVQSAIHGLDNSAVEDAIEAGEGRYLGVALVPANVADAELQRLAGKGFRGVRFNFMKHLAGGASIDEVVTLTQRLKPLGLHLQVHFESSLIHSLAPALLRSAVPVMVDHMGRVDATQGLAGADFQALCDLLTQPQMHVKVSGIDRIDAHAFEPSAGQGAAYAQGIALARHLVERFPDRCVWGSDWPHPNHTHIPDDGVLVDAIAQLAPEPAQRQQLLVDNPANFYRFSN
jgi:2-pyrone-4,6-dicarboxylate lactonase